MNHSPQRRRLLLAGAGAALIGAGRAVQAQPAQTLRIVVGFPAGGTADALARSLAPMLSGPDLNVIVENRAGATGQLAADATRQAADGATVLLTPSSVLSLTPQLYRKPLYDGLADFAPLGCVCDHAFGFAVPAQSPHATVADYVAWARANPTATTYATPGAGSSPHFLGALMSREVSVPMVHVPYRGVVPGVQDLIGGQVSATFNPVTSLIEFHKAGRLRILAVSSPTRLASLPQVPTFAEARLPALELLEWYGFFASARAPAATIANLQRRIAQALAQPALAEMARRLEVTARPLAAAEQKRLLDADHRRWKTLVQSTGIQLEV